MPTISAVKLLPMMLPLLAVAQTTPTFEAASIKPDKQCPGPYGHSVRGHLALNCYSIQELAAFAWGLRSEQVVGQSLPERYNIEATLDAANAGQADVRHNAPGSSRRPLRIEASSRNPRYAGLQPDCR